MTAAEIRAKKIDSAWECTIWLQEIAAQLATLNTNIRELIDATRPKPSR